MDKRLFFRRHSDHHMSLKKIFGDRIQRATSVLEGPGAGPTLVTFSSKNLASEHALTVLHDRLPKGGGGHFYLYQLSLSSQETDIASRARVLFRAARAENTHNMSRDNEAHPDSTVLYVGTSKSLYARFRTHLGRGNGSKTWALYLASWAKPLNTDFTIEYYQFRDTVTEDVELIEGVLWDSLRPLFGKKGGK